MLNSNGESSKNIGRICAFPSASLESVLFCEDLVTYLQANHDNAKEAPAVLEFVERHFYKLLKGALQPVELANMMLSTNSIEATTSQPSLNDANLVLFVVNATELIYFYVSTSRSPMYYVEHIVPSVITTLSKKSSLTSTVAQCSRRLLLGAFEVSPVMTTKAITSTLNEKAVDDLITSISTNFIVADTIMAMFGSALRASEIISPATEMRMFTEGWIRYGFAQCLASHMAIALTSIDYQPYFHFIKELLKRGFSHSAGPVIDAFMEYSIISQAMTSILEACENAVSNPQRYPLLTSGVEVLHAIVTLMRQSLIAPDTKEMYAADITLVSPIHFLHVHAQRFGDLLVLKKSYEASSPPQQNRVEPALVALCEMFVELLRFHMRDTDQIIVRIRFLENLLDICCSYPECYRLTLFLQQSLLTVFFPPLFVNDPNNEVNVVLKHLVDQESENSEVQGFLSKCVSICTDESLRYTSLSAFLIDVCHRLAHTPLFKNSSFLLQNVVEPLLGNSFVMGRIRNMEKPITGEQFAAVGSGGTARVQHRPLVNYANDSLLNNDRSSPSPSSNEPLSFPKNWTESDGTDGVCGVEDETSRPHVDGSSELVFVEKADVDDEASDNEPVNVEFSVMDVLVPFVEDTVTVEPVWIDESLEIETSPQDKDFPMLREVREDELKEEDVQNDMENGQKYPAKDPVFDLRSASVDSADGDAWVQETIVAMEDVLDIVKES